MLKKLDNFYRYIIFVCSLIAIWVIYNVMFAYLFILGMSYILQAVSCTACVEPLLSELIEYNARLDLGPITLNPFGDICMMKMESSEVPGHPCNDLKVVTQKAQPSGSVQTCFHFDAWLNCVSKTNQWGAMKTSVTEWAAKQANLEGKIYCFDVPGTQTQAKDAK